MSQMETKPYYGLMNGPLTHTLALGINVTLKYMGVVQYLCLLFLVGMDVLSRERAHQWNFGGVLL